MTRWICPKIALAVFAVGTDFVLGLAVLAATLLIDGNCKPPGLLVPSFLALS